MSYLGLETVKPIKPMKRGDLYSFPITTIDQIVTDEETNERLSEYLDKNFGMDLLWENASPTSAFAKQTLTLSGVSEGDLIRVETNQGIWEFVMVEDKTITMDYITIWSTTSGVSTTIRHISITSANTIEIGDCYNANKTVTSANQGNTYLIPLRISKVK